MNATVKIALSFALATTVLCAAIAWREASVVDVIKAADALNAGAAEMVETGRSVAALPQHRREGEWTPATCHGGRPVC